MGRWARPVLPPHRAGAGLCSHFLVTSRARKLGAVSRK